MVAKETYLLVVVLKVGIILCHIVAIAVLLCKKFTDHFHSVNFAIILTRIARHLVLCAPGW